MRQSIRTIAITAGLCFFIAGAAGAKKLNVVATLPEIGALVEEIGGDRVKVEVLAKGNEDPHFLPAKPSHSRRMMKADLVVYNGMQLEVGWLPLLIDGARNSAIRWGGPGNLSLARFVEPLEVPAGSIDRSMGDIHPEGNPHFTADPSVYPDLARGIADRLIRIDPDGTEEYEKRLASFIERWDKLLAGWKKRLEPIAGMRVVTYHQQWEYMARAFDLQIVDQIEDRPGIPPAPRHLNDLEKRIAEEGIRWIFYSDLVYREIPEKMAGRTGCRAVALPHSVDSRKGTGDLESWFETLVSILASTRKE